MIKYRRQFSVVRCAVTFLLLLDYSIGLHAQEGPESAGGMEGGLDSKVVGTPVPMSPSVRAACDKAPCEDIFRRLTEMVQQPRDLNWAPSMEENLKKIILAEAGTFEIRLLECRKTLCAVEVASVEGALPFNDRVSRSDLTRKKLKPDFTPIGIEPVPSGSIDGRNVYVTFSLFDRR